MSARVAGSEHDQTIVRQTVFDGLVWVRIGFDGIQVELYSIGRVCVQEVVVDG